ncbi:MAG: hypothetical protein MUO40_03345 [Anaerolineaceae bacterium]|nr:hypothetical protein [Anaerolineaceae bacterium]
MISLSVFFWIFVGLFAIIGAIRGWSKELLVTFSGVLGIFIVTVLLPLIDNSMTSTSLFWAQTIIFALVVFFGYQTPNFRKLSESGRFVRETIKDTVIGMILGTFNGYMIIGSLWYYMDKAGYPLTSITAPDQTTAVGQYAAKILAIVPPVVMTGNFVYFAIAIAFVIVLVIFL